MTRDEKEKQRHEKYQKALAEADIIDELPQKIGFTKIKEVLCQEINYGRKNIRKVYTDEVDDIAKLLILKEDYINSEKFKEDLFLLLKDAKDPRERANKVLIVLASKKLRNYLQDMRDYDERLREFSKAEALVQHHTTMHQIKSAKSVNELPKVNNSDINNQILKTLRPAFHSNRLTVDRVKQITERLLEGYSLDKTEVLILLEKLWNTSDLLYEIFTLGLDDRRKIVYGSLEKDFKLSFLVEELRAKNARTLEIYKEEHDRIMKSISNANRISEMPTGFSLSRITNYLSGNSVINKNDAPMPGAWFNVLAELLLQGSSLETSEVQTEIMKIAGKYCTEIRKCDEKDAAIVSASVAQALYWKFAKLPKLRYYVEEVRYAAVRQKEFISRGAQRVKAYFMLSDKSPVEGGNFYCIYLSRKEGPKLDLERIMKNAGEVEDVEKYIKDNFDPTFKRAGGIILNRDERIDSDVSVYTPDDGSIGISPEAKANYTALEDLSTELNALLEANKKALEENEKQQAEFKKQQELNAEEIGKVQSKINTLVKTLKAKDKKEDKKEEKEEEEK